MQGSAFYGDLRDAAFYGDLRDATIRIGFPENFEARDLECPEWKRDWLGRHPDAKEKSSPDDRTILLPLHWCSALWIVPVFDDGSVPGCIGKITGIREAVSDAEVSGLLPGCGETAVIPAHPAGTVLLAGIGKKHEKWEGKKTDLDARTLTKLSREAGKAVRKLDRFDYIISALPAARIEGTDTDARVRISTEAMIEGSWKLTAWKSPASGKDKHYPIHRNIIICPGEQAETDVPKCDQAVYDGVHLASAVLDARDLGSVPGNICHPEYLAKKASSLAGPGVTVDVLDRDGLKREGMNGYLAAAAGSPYPPFMSVISYRGADVRNAETGHKPHVLGASPFACPDEPVVLIGKGLCFDSGGLSLKPSAGMEEMKYDKCGAAVVYAVMKAVISMHLPVNVTGIMCGAENIPGGFCYRPGDIITMKNGLNVEVVNTDAEGRMVLADALTYAEKFKPAATIDIATLTGGCVVALGHAMTGLLTDDDRLAKKLLDAGRETGDFAWRLPLSEEYSELVDSEIGDVLQSAGRDASPVTAAEFLKRFRPKSGKWAHLDIAGTGWNSRGIKGPTGRPAALLLEYIMNIVRAMEKHHQELADRIEQLVKEGRPRMEAENEVSVFDSLFQY